MSIKQPQSIPSVGSHKDEAIRTTHPAYAQVSVSRVTGHFTLYGSDLNHRSAIKLTVKRSELQRALNYDSHFCTDELIEVYMSENQWATLLCQMNVFEGVPATLSRYNGESVDQLPPPADRTLQFKEEAEKKCKKALKQLRDLQEVLDDTSMSAKARAVLKEHVRMAIQELKANLPFVLQCFDEHMQDTLASGKQELLAFAAQHNMMDQFQKLTSSKGNHQNLDDIDI